jgi:hypothetical protein
MQLGKVEILFGWIGVHDVALLAMFSLSVWGR